MEFATNTAEIIGLLAILSSFTVIFVQVMQWLMGRVHNKVRSSFFILVSMTIVYYAEPTAMRVMALTAYAHPVSQALAVIWWLCLAFLVDLSIRRFVWQPQIAEHGFSPLPKLVKDLISLMIYAAAVMVVMHFVFDESIGAVLATSGGVAFVLGFAAQKTLSEAFAGLSLSLSKTLRVGDYLEVNGVYGQVYDLNWRNISLKSPNTASLHIFPNSTVASSMVVNYSQPNDQFKNWVTFLVEPHASPDFVINVVKQELKGCRYVMSTPAPDINLLGFEELGIKYRVRYCFEGDDPWWDAQNEVVNAIWNGMRKHGLRFGIHRRLLDSGEEWARQVEPVFVEPDKLDIADTLRMHPLFAKLDETHLAQIAHHATLCEFNPPETMVEQGVSPVFFYLILSGAVSHTLQRDGQRFQVAESYPGDICGFADDYGVITSMQPSVYSRLIKLPYHIVTEGNLQSAFLPFLQQWRTTVEEAFEQEALNHIAKQHTHYHRRLTQTLKEGYSKFFDGTIPAKLIGAVLSRDEESQLVEILAEACALLVVAGNDCDRSLEREKYLEIMSHLEHIHHISTRDMLRRYDEALRDADSNFTELESLVCRHLQGISNQSTEGKLLLQTMHYIAGVSGHPTPAQQKLLKGFAETLGHN